MSTLKFSLLLFLLLNISACAQFGPFEDRRREPGTEYVYIGESKPSAPSVCYNPLLSSDSKLQQKADELCKNNNPQSKAEFVRKEYFSCRLFVPAKAYYKCVAE